MKLHPVFLVLLVFLPPVVIRGQTEAPGRPVLLDARKIWDQSPHNAFTDLIRFQGKWFCAFRESDAHVGGDGCVRILESVDGADWHSAARIAEEGVDLRDPKLSVTPKDELMVLAGGSIYRGTTRLQGRQPRVAFSKDGKEWTAPAKVLGEGDWLWRVTWHKGRAYGVSYGAPVVHSSDTPDPVWSLRLYASEDGLRYTLVTLLKVSGRPNETTLRFLEDGRMVALVRREGDDAQGWIGASSPPYRDWTWHPIGHRLGGPNFIVAPDGRLWAGSRSYPGGARTVVASMTLDHFEPILTLPSGGDTSYPGMVWHDGILWMSYYSSHEGKTAIYLARIRLP